MPSTVTVSAWWFEQPRKRPYRPIRVSTTPCRADSPGSRHRSRGTAVAAAEVAALPDREPRPASLARALAVLAQRPVRTAVEDAPVSDAERARIGVHTCPGGDQDSTHTVDVDYSELLPDLFAIDAGRLFVQMASEADRPRALDIVARERRLGQTVYVGATDPIDPRVETAAKVCERILEAVEHLGTEGLGSTDDCGFSPFGDDVSTVRETAFAKIRARVEGTKLAQTRLG